MACFFQSYISGASKCFRWKNSPLLPRGLLYEGVSDEPIRLSGLSAAQSSTIQCFDALLCIQHEDEAGRKTFCFSTLSDAFYKWEVHKKIHFLFLLFNKEPTWKVWGIICLLTTCSWSKLSPRAHRSATSFFPGPDQTSAGCTTGACQLL